MNEPMAIIAGSVGAFIFGLWYAHTLWKVLTQEGYHSKAIILLSLPLLFSAFSLWYILH